MRLSLSRNRHDEKFFFFFPLSELVFTDHKRTVNRIQFHPVERDVLLSGSQDGTVKFFVRQNVVN